MSDLDIGYEEEKKVVFKKILKFKKQKELNDIKLIEQINITINNLKLIDEFIKKYTALNKAPSI